MKRKRGNKKSKRKGRTEVAGKEGNSLVTEENSGLEELDHDNNDSAMEIDTPSSTGTDHLNVPNVNPESSMDKPAGKSTVGRVKVKLRTSKMMDVQLNSSDALTQSDTDKSSPQMGLEKQSVVSEKMEDSANSLPEKEIAVTGIASKKPGSIKIKSSKSLGLGINPTSTAVKPQGGSGIPQQDSRPNKKELNSALTVIKKIMKMDAAEPFNVPVNPVALGIPDYFDVIDTPMDFGTICSNLESSVKYMNSKDVFKDVQYVWENCYKYNNKGDYILDLMRRVKKNFSKYWAAAGLYNGQVLATNGVDTTQENGGASGQVKPLKGTKQKTKKRHGRRHKSDCLCAICVLKRRRKEREEIARISKDQIGAGNNLAQEFKVEESVRGESPGSVDSSSNADDSLDNDLDVEEETGEEVKMDVSKQQFSTPEEKQDEGEEEEDEEGNEMERKTAADSKGSEQSERSREDRNRPSKSSMEQSADLKMEDVLQHDGGRPDLLDAERNKEAEEKQKKKLKAWEELSTKNPKLLELCGVVFPTNPRSVWRGPHSLLPPQQTSRVSSIHMAIRQFMKN